MNEWMNEWMNEKRGAVMNMALLENMRWEVTGGRERVRQNDDRVERIGWISLDGEEFAKVGLRVLGRLQGIM